MRGIDAAFNLSPYASKLRAAGIGFAGRYYSYRSGKDLTPAEAKALTEAGLQIVSVWEAKGDVYASFNAPQGEKDAGTALYLAQHCGQPLGSTIYFAVDFDATSDELTHGIIAYFQAANGLLHDKYEVGAYGSGSVLARLFSAGLATRLWLAQSRGWSGTHGFEGAHIVQGPTDHSLLLFPVDTNDTASDDFGGWRVGDAARPVAATPVPSALPKDGDLRANIAALQKQLQARGYYGGKIDGIAGAHTIAAIMAWQHDA